MNTHWVRQIGPRGFTLIEVLMSILILALGLLGLGAVFPGVISLQRNAADATLGVAVGNNATAYVLARPDLNRNTSPFNALQWWGFGVWVLDPSWSLSPDFRWVVNWGEVDLLTGDMQFDPGQSDSPVIKLADRLWPSESVEGKNPVYVWDIVGRRRKDNYSPGSGPGYDQTVGYLQLAIFVRRIDPGIRVAPGLTLHEVLTDPSIPDRDKRLPVAVDQITGRPTLNGLDQYGIIQELDVETINDRRDRLQMRGTEVLRKLASQIGQKLVDNLGNIYTVTGVDETRSDVVLIDPPIPTWALTNSTVRIDQVIFSPQVPSGVTVVDLTIRNPV